MHSPAILWFIVGVTIVMVIAFVAMATTMISQAAAGPPEGVEKGEKHKERPAPEKPAEEPPPVNVAGF